MSRTWTALALCLGLIAPLGALATEIGTVAASNTQIDGTPPNAPTRTLQLSDRLSLDERVVSSATGNGQFLFDDQTSLTIAPNTDIVLDSYVYDPARDAGDIAVSFNKGVMRFIGGRISKSSDATVTTPVATIGIRGGIALMQMTSDTDLTVTHVAGEYTKVTSGGSTLTLSRTNATATVQQGQPPVYVGVASSGEIGALYDALQGDGDGGSTNAGGVPGSGLAGLGDDSTAAGLPPVATDGAAPEDVETLDNNFNISGLEPADQNLRVQNETFIRDTAENAGGVVVPIGGEGLVRGQLIWRNTSDLDLHLFLPDGAGEVFFGNPSITFNDGGATATLDADNLGGVVNVQPDQRVENIAVTGTNIPAGTYTFIVDNFSNRGNAVTDFELITTGNGRDFTSTRGSLGAGEESPGIPVVSPGGQFEPPSAGGADNTRSPGS